MADGAQDRTSIKDLFLEISLMISCLKISIPKSARCIPLALWATTAYYRFLDNTHGYASANKGSSSVHFCRGEFVAKRSIILLRNTPTSRLALASYVLRSDDFTFVSAYVLKRDFCIFMIAKASVYQCGIPLRPYNRQLCEIYANEHSSCPAFIIKLQYNSEHE